MKILLVCAVFWFLCGFIPVLAKFYKYGIIHLCDVMESVLYGIGGPFTAIGYLYHWYSKNCCMVLWRRNRLKKEGR